MSSIAVQSDKVRALKAAHAPQVEVTEAIEELKRLMAQNEDVKEASSSAQPQRPSGAVPTLESAAAKIRALKLAHSSQAAVSQAVAEYTTLKTFSYLDPVAVAAERIRVLKSAKAPTELVVAAIDEYKAVSTKRAAPEPAKPVAAPTQIKGDAPRAQPQAISQPSPSIETLAQKVKTLKATGAAQEQVAEAVAQLSALKNQKSLNPQTVAEAKVRALKDAKAPQEVVVRAVEELKALKTPSVSTENFDLVKVTKEEKRKQGAGTTGEVKRSAPETSAVTSESKGAKTAIWESENFDDFQARIATRPSCTKASFVSATGLSPPLAASEIKVPENLSAFQQASEKAEQRINELSALCDKHFKLTADPAELQRLRAENVRLMAQNAALRKLRQEKLGGVPAVPRGNEKKAPSVPVVSSGSEKKSPSLPAASNPAFVAWQRSLEDLCAKLSSSVDAPEWPGEYWIEEARKSILAAGQRSDLDTLAADPATGKGRATRFILKRIPPP